MSPIKVNLQVLKGTVENGKQCANSEVQARAIALKPKLLKLNAEIQKIEEEYSCIKAAVEEELTEKLGAFLHNTTHVDERR